MKKSKLMEKIKRKKKSRKKKMKQNSWRLAN